MIIFILILCLPLIFAIHERYETFFDVVYVILGVCSLAFLTHLAWIIIF